MVAAVETMAWTGEVPWHHEGVKVGADLTPEEMMIAAGLDWNVSKRPGYTIDTPKYGEESGLIQAVDTYHLVRDSDNTILASCGPVYIPTQNRQVFNFFKKFSTAADFTMETAGSLRGGKSIWALAKVPCDFELSGGDKVEGYLLFHSPHEPGQALTGRFTPVRVVCNNTLQYAMQSGAASFRMSHIHEFDGKIAHKAAEILGLTQEANAEFKQAAEFLVSKKAKHENVLEFVAHVYQPDILETRRQERELKAAGKKVGEEAPLMDEFNRYSKLAVEALEKAPGAHLKSAAGTWWGALNSITYVEDHLRSGENAVYNSLLGVGSKRKSRALDLALDYAKAA